MRDGPFPRSSFKVLSSNFRTVLFGAVTLDDLVQSSKLAPDEERRPETGEIARSVNLFVESEWCFLPHSDVDLLAEIADDEKAM